MDLQLIADEIVTALEPRLGDFNDDLRAQGAEALRQHLRKGSQGAGQGVKHRLRNRVVSFSSSRLSNPRRHPHVLQEMGRRPSKVTTLQGRGATDFRRRGRAPPLHREANQPPPVLLHIRSGPEGGVKGRPQ
eukprot:gene51188-62595_t